MAGVMRHPVDTAAECPLMAASAATLSAGCFVSESSTVSPPGLGVFPAVIFFAKLVAQLQPLPWAAQPQLRVPRESFRAFRPAVVGWILRSVVVEFRLVL